ncbi:TPA: SRPBCC family protein, partial [Acinetobacter baumannii]|nr:SRPBCC family protein [Acinetobacter baumannii]
MANAIATLEIPASPEQVWQLIGGFDSLPDWLPFVAKSELSEGARVRSLILADGGNVVERLEAFNQQERTYSYSIIKAPFPIVDYLSTITVLETDKPNVSLVEWKGQFTPVNVSDEEV